VHMGAWLSRPWCGAATERVWSFGKAGRAIGQMVCSLGAEAARYGPAIRCATCTLQRVHIVSAATPIAAVILFLFPLALRLRLASCSAPPV
jgi:hypothetical protein